MARPAKSSLQSLQRIVEDASSEDVREFVGQCDANFAEFAAKMAACLHALQNEDDGPRRAFLTTATNLEPETYLPVEVEAQRVLLLAEGKGPSALRMIAGQKLTNDAFENVFEKRGELAAALRANAFHRQVFDDAVSFRNARLWRDGKLYSAFDVDLEHPKPIEAAAVETEQLLEAIRLRLKLSVKCGVSVVDLPQTEAHRSSVLVIIRIPKDVTGIPEHLDNGGRRLRFIRPQKEVILIYTPEDQRIEICADTAPERAIVSECFATKVLGHDVSKAPLTWVNDWGSPTVGATFFAERNCDPGRLVEAKLIVRNGVEKEDDDVADDDEGDRPSAGDRTTYTICVEWLEQRLMEALQGVLATTGKQTITPNLLLIGGMPIDGRQVPCYLARGLRIKKTFVETEVQLRARAGAGPGIVFCGADPDWRCIGPNLLYVIPRQGNGAPEFSRLDRSSIEAFYRANLGLALGGTTLTLVENDSGDAGTLIVPGKAELPLLSKQQVRCFRLLVEAKLKGVPGVKTGELLGDSRSKGCSRCSGASGGRSPRIIWRTSATACGR